MMFATIRNIRNKGIVCFKIDPQSETIRNTLIFNQEVFMLEFVNML